MPESGPPRLCYTTDMLLVGSARRRLVLAVVLMCFLPAAMDVTILTIAVPTLAGELDASPTELLWIVDVLLASDGRAGAGHRAVGRPDRAQAAADDRAGGVCSGLGAVRRGTRAAGPGRGPGHTGGRLGNDQPGHVGADPADLRRRPRSRGGHRGVERGLRPGHRPSGRWRAGSCCTTSGGAHCSWSTCRQW